MDERFSTPRAQASTSRSTASSSYGTPRSFSLQSSRSLQGYSSSDSDDITPRLAANPSFILNEKNPEIIRFNRASNNTVRDYSRDFRRFETQNPYQSRLSQSFDPRNATNSSPKHDCHDSYVTRAWDHNKHDSPHQSRIAHSHEMQSEDIFSLSRHGKVGHVERLLTSGVSSDIKDEHGNTILVRICLQLVRMIIDTDKSSTDCINVNRTYTIKMFSAKFFT